MAKRDLMLLTAESVMIEASRALRRRVRIALHVDQECDILPLLREVSEVWGFAKDGKGMFFPSEEKLLRK